MEIVLLVLIAGVWGAFVVPTAVAARREGAVTHRQTLGMTPAGISAEHRRRVLGRRRTALVTLGIAAVVTLVGAIVTGSSLLLILSLLVDLVLAAYVAVLLQIKQRKQMAPTGSSEPRSRVSA